MIIRSGDMSARGVYWLAAAMLLCVPRLATPQSAVAAAPRAWVAVSAAIASQAEGDEECPNVCGPVAGAGLAFGLSASARLSSRTAGVVEGMLGPSLHAEQPSGIAAKETILNRHLIPMLGAKRLDAITNESVQQLKLALKAKSAKTTNNVLTVLDVLLKEGRRVGRHRAGRVRFGSSRSRRRRSNGRTSTCTNVSSPFSTQSGKDTSRQRREDDCDTCR